MTDSAATIATTTTGLNATAAVVAAKAVLVIDAGAVSAAGDTVTVTDGNGVTDTVTLVDTDGNGDVSNVEFATQVAAATYTDYVVTGSNASLGEVYLQGKVAELTTQVVGGTSNGIAAASGTDNAGSTITTAEGVAAAAFVANATVEVQTLTVTNGADQAGTVIMAIDTDADGVTENYTFNLTAGNEGQVAAQLATQINALAGVSAVQGAAGATIDDVIITWDAKTASSVSALQNAADTTFVDGAIRSAAVAETTKGLEATSTPAATWVVNTTNTDITDLNGANKGVTSLLYKASLTVTYSGATTRGASGVTTGAAVALDNGFESTVTVGTTDYLGNHANINQAIKDAIIGDGVEGGGAGDNVLEELLSVADGPANALVITSQIDGEFAKSDLAITLKAVTYSTLSSSEQTSIQNALRDLDNNSAATYTADEVQARLDAAVANFATSGALTKLAMGTTTDGTTLLAGSASTGHSDNTVTLGTGDDVVVLGTEANSNDMLLYVGTSNGTDVVVNFTQSGAAADSINFTSYLNAKTSTSGSTISAVTPAITLNADNAASVNEVTIINTFAQTSTETWAGLTEANLLAALNNDGTESWGSIVESNLDATTVANLVGTTYNHIVMVENDKNDGEYKVFNLTATSGSDFTAAALVGTIDFGNTLDAVTSANFDGTLFV